MQLHSDRPIAVDVRDAVKVYGDFTALKRVSLSIHDNEFFTLLGPSGSGKTTLLMMIAGFQEATSGEILMDGASITKRDTPNIPAAVVCRNF